MNRSCTLCTGLLLVVALTGCKNTAESTGDVAGGAVRGTGTVIQGVGEGTGTIIKGVGEGVSHVGEGVSKDLKGDSEKEKN